jgi:hypothetical protein
MTRQHDGLVCGACGKPLHQERASVTFPNHHARCIDRAIALARAEHAVR